MIRNTQLVVKPDALSFFTCALGFPLSGVLGSWLWHYVRDRPFSPEQAVIGAVIGCVAAVLYRRRVGNVPCITLNDAALVLTCKNGHVVEERTISLTRVTMVKLWHSSRTVWRLAIAMTCDREAMERLGWWPVALGPDTCICLSSQAYDVDDMRRLYQALKDRGIPEVDASWLDKIGRWT